MSDIGGIERRKEKEERGGAFKALLCDILACGMSRCFIEAMTLGQMAFLMRRFAGIALACTMA